MSNYRISIITILTIVILLLTSLNVVPLSSSLLYNNENESLIKNFDVSSKLINDLPNAITVSDSDPFYLLIATPLAIHYDESGDRKLIPLYVKNIDNPSKSIIRTERQIGIYTDFIISDLFNAKELSLDIAKTFWEEANTALLIKQDKLGYEMGIVATPIASYLSVPVIITDEIDTDVKEVLDHLGIEYLYICGDLYTDSYWSKNFLNIDEIIDECIDIIDNRFKETINYITMANPLDVFPPKILDTKLFNFVNTIGSSTILPMQSVGMLFQNIYGDHEFEIPVDYKYCKISINLTNINSEDTELLGDRLTLLLYGPDGNRYLFGSTAGGIPKRDKKGNIIFDNVNFETTMYNSTGDFRLRIIGQWFARKEGEYKAEIILEKLDSPIVPLMKGLSSIAPYLTAYHKGIVFAKSDFAFAADDDKISNGKKLPGSSQPGMNYNLTIPSNEHTIAIHLELNNLLAKITGIPEGEFEQLTNYYVENPIYIAITADPTMVPMYFYYNPDGEPHSPGADILGYSLPSDFIWGDIDVNISDPENNTFTYWPFMENIVGRVSGRDVQDCSALIARTFFYNSVLENYGDWKDNALVQTGCGLEFQNLPIITRLSKMLYQGRGDPTKFPTGESTFINMRLAESMKSGYDNVKNTFLLQSQREGFSDEGLDKIKKAGILNLLLFPKRSIEFWSSDKKVTGGVDHLNSNFIFSFAHGSYNLFEHGDVLIDSKGFPFVTTVSRVYPRVRSSLSNKGTFDVRSIDNMEYGPSVIFIVSCITGRTDGIPGKNVLSQSFIHAGANAYIGATRVTADPGYLEPRPLPGGLGIGTLGFIKATLDLFIKKEYPDLHFGAVIAEDFIYNLIENDATVGRALRDAKNIYLKKDANSTFLWTPPLTLSSEYIVYEPELLPKIITNGLFDGNTRTRTLDKKYVALHEFTLYGDPAFNPYQSVNNG